MSDKRFGLALNWAQRTLDNSNIHLRPASEDASFRRYLRVHGADRSYILMDAPPDKEDIRPFVRAARRFIQLGLNVPEVLAVDPKQGFLLLSDLGDTTYLQRLTPSNADRLYGDALGALIVLQAGSFTEPRFLPPYSNELLMQEMQLFRDWFLTTHVELTLNLTQRGMLDDVFTRLMHAAAEQPTTWVHRDYHSRNLMVTETNNPGILDFQDAVTGPITYDLVSLLRDCYIEWPTERVAEWAQGYFDLARQSGLPVGDDEQRFIQWFDWMGIQRHLKAIGIFARLYHRDGKSGFLNDIPRVLVYVHNVAEQYAQLRPLNALVAPLLSGD